MKALQKSILGLLVKNLMSNTELIKGYALFLLKQSPKHATQLANAIKEKITDCEINKICQDLEKEGLIAVQKPEGGKSEIIYHLTDRGNATAIKSLQKFMDIDKNQFFKEECLEKE